MAENNTKLNEGMYVIGGLFIAIAALMFASPSMPSMENDWVSLPLIGVPILGSLLLMAFASVVPSWKKESISESSLVENSDIKENQAIKSETSQTQT